MTSTSLAVGSTTWDAQTRARAALGGAARGDGLLKPGDIACCMLLDPAPAIRMSENLDLVRSFYAKTERGDFSFVDREPELRDFYAPDFEWHTREDLPDAGVRRGYEGLARLRAEWAETFDDLHLDVDELIDAGDHVVAVARICGCLRGSGHQLEVQETQVWKMRDGRATEVRAYLTRSEALNAVGLEG
jgi:ketosteroid isomerase-like protein